MKYIAKKESTIFESLLAVWIVRYFYFRDFNQIKGRDNIYTCDLMNEWEYRGKG